MLFFELLFIFYILVYFYTMTSEARQIGIADYLSSFWTYIDIGIVMLAGTAGVFYVLRYMTTNSISSNIQETNGMVYVNLGVGV